MEQTTAGPERSEPGESEQDEEEDVYEVERIIDMRTEEGEVLYRVRWKNYTSDDDTWEPEAHLEDCREVLLAYKRKLAESKARKDTTVVEAEQVEVTAEDASPQKLPMKSDLFDADSESEGERKGVSPPKKKKKKKKSSKESVREPSPDSYRGERKKEKKKRWRQERVLPAPETDGSESEEAPPPTPPRSQKRAADSRDEDEVPITPKKHKPKDSSKPRKEGRKWRELDSSQEEEERAEEEEAAVAEEDSSGAPWVDARERSPTPMLSSKPIERQEEEVPDTSKASQKKVKVGLKLQGIRDLIQERKWKQAQPPQRESTQQKLKKLLSGGKAGVKGQGQVPALHSVTGEEAGFLSSDSGDAPNKRKSKGKETSSSSPSSSSTGPIARDDETRPDMGLGSSGGRGKEPAPTSSSSSSSLSQRSMRQEDERREEREQPVSTNLFEKFLLNCEAKDRMPRKQAAHLTTPESRDSSKNTATKAAVKLEKKAKHWKPEQDRTDKTKRDTRTPESSRLKQSPPQVMERRESTDSLTDRQTSLTTEERREEAPEKEEPLDKREELVSKREELVEKRKEPQEKKEEPQDKREGSQNIIGASQDKMEEVPHKREETSDKREGLQVRGEEPREKREGPLEKRERPEDARVGGRGERKGADVALPDPAEEAAGRRKERRRRKEDSEPQLFTCNDNQEPQDRAPDRGQASLSLGVDLKLDWMSLEDFQKHLNGEDEMLTGGVISPSELRDAVKTGDYLAVKLALSSKEDYNLDQEDSSGMSLAMLAAAGGQDDILRLLIKKGVKVNARQKNGTTAVMHAAEKNFLTTVAILLEAGAYVNAQTLNGETALMKACKRGNGDVVRLLLEYGADCNILSKHQNNALHFAKISNNMAVYDCVKDHMSTLSSVAEETIRAYFETRLALLEPVFPLACHRLCEGPDFSLDFSYKPPTHCPAEGSGILLFVFHANFLSEITARLCGPCSVHAVVLNDKFQLPIFLDSHFIYSFSPVQGQNKLFIRLAESPTAKVKLLICAYRVQLQ
ncbi:hypothetical protein AGOR_G00220000 [Albula goreensis]|uniref:Chromo domain-containing protein n=1 Tax=Albula goreensis TaxID=1534307 RepID=A0A8T3CK32_9TELE|nr:hypothetical protein AGOR_G00220000 [Albula goreensis]